jgi:plastocyanin
MQPCTRWAPISLHERTNAGYGAKIIGYWGDLAARVGIMISCTFALSILIAPRAIGAPPPPITWQASAGSQSTDEGIQALAFLPNELWIHAGDSITWTFPTPEIHTVTFLKQDTAPEQVRPPRPGAGGGCSPPPGGTTPDKSSFDGSTCLTSPELIDAQTYTVKFPTPGNFKLVCLVHNNMTGAVHVLAQSAKLPHDQAFYDKQARERQADLLSDGAALEDRATDAAKHSFRDAVSVGIGEIVATGGGSDTVSVMRFLQGSIYVRVGDTVEWTNLDPVTPHTVTFGAEPANPVPPSAGVTTDTDGALHAMLSSAAPDAHSGFLQAAFQDQTGLPQTPLGVTRFRVTFTGPGIFNYICALHDDLGMTGKVIVHR